MIRMLLPAAAIALLAGCDGADVGDSCAARDDCASDQYCAGPDEPQVCGIPPREDCASDADCGPDQACHAISDVCSSDGQGSTCGPPCTANSCNPGFRCGAGGGCEAIPCDESGGCAAFETCDPGFDAATPVYSRTAGCRAIACGADAPCADPNVCVNGRCQSAAGSCALDLPVP